jgi:flagellar biogenesis protein FliO
MSAVTEHIGTEWRSTVSVLLHRVWQACRRGLQRDRGPKQLRLCESLALGEKRLVAVLQFGEQRFLIGGTANSVTLLAELQNLDAKQHPDAQVRR